MYYYLNSSSEQVGPVDIQQLKAAGIKRETLVWKEGMKEWAAAGTLPELAILWAAAPPPPKPPIPGSSPSLAVEKPADSRKRLIAMASGGAILLLIAIIVFTRSRSEGTRVAGDLKKDSLEVNNDVSRDESKEKTDSVKLIDLDTMANRLKWDTVAVRTDSTANAGDVSFLPGFGAQDNVEKKSEKSGQRTGDKSASGGNKSRNKKKQAEINRDDEVVQNDEQNVKEDEPVKPQPANAARSMSIIGSFRKNLLFEAVLEGTITNRNNAQVRDVIVEVWFLDASGQPVGNKRFTQHGPVAAGASSPFRFKTNPPKGAKGARFEIASASWR